MRLTTTINGDLRTTDIDGHEAAVDVIREHLGLTGTKLVCGGGVCGACTVQIDGVPAAGCLTPAVALDNADVTTVEGISHESQAESTGADPGHDRTTERLHPVQKAFLVYDGLQCGYCTSGFIVSAAAFHDRWRAEQGMIEPDRHTIADALAGHLCRCGAYEGIYRAVAAACRGEFDEGPVSPARIDGVDKVTGRAVYTADIYPDNTLHAVIVRSPVGAADVGPLPVDAAQWLVDLLPEDRRVRWAGQPMAAVAADSLAEARRLADELPLSITERAFNTDPARALVDGAPAVYQDRKSRKLAGNAAEGPILPTRWSGNRRGPTPTPFLGTVAKRRIKKARDDNDTGLVELDIGTGVQLHASFEPHCTVADWTDPTTLRVHTSTQAVDHVAHLIAERFDLRPDQVEVTSDFIGGGFGSKLSMTPDMVAAIELSGQARRPVRLVLDRREELTATGNRPGSATSVSLLADGDGDLKAMVVDAEAHTGTAINGLYGALCVLMYDRSPRIAYDSDVITNAPPGTPFRGPGGPTYAWALEQAVDQMAHQLGCDPIDLRTRWDGNDKRQALYTWAAELDVWRSRPATGSQTGRIRRGVGLAAANWLYMHDPSTEVEVGVEGDRLVVATASQDMGTGSKTVLANAVGRVFGIDPDQIVVRMGRSAASVPHGPTSGGSRTTASLWPAALEAAERLRDQIGGDVASAPPGTSVVVERSADLDHRRFGVNIGDDLRIGRGFSAAVHVTEVEVDTLTGRTRVLTVHGGLAIGVPHAPRLAISQCEGSIIQGIGLALYEDQVLDPHTGQTLTCNLEDYRIPQLGDTPEITIHFHPDGWDHVPGTGVGLGEVATISPAASVANAVFNATGWRPTTAPIRPDRVLEGLS